MSPRKSLPPVDTAMALKPSTASMKNSGGPNSNTTALAIGMTASMNPTPISPPSAEAVAAAPMAVPALPCRASGYPSKQVAAFGAAPGVFSSIADNEPPKGTPPMMPPTSTIAESASMPNVSGISSASAVVPPRPGMAPNNSPIAVPSDR